MILVNLIAHEEHHMDTQSRQKKVISRFKIEGIYVDTVSDISIRGVKFQ